MTHGSIFTGICGFDAGFHEAGIDTRWQIELDPDARAIERRHFPRALRFDDVCEVDGDLLPTVDIVSFGSPCQDLSVAGEQAGLVDGARSCLFFHAARIIHEMRIATHGRYPQLAVWENVPNALGSKGRRDFATILATFQDLGATDIAWRILDARWFGVAQRRRRVFLVVDFAGERAGEILLEPHGMRRNPPPRRKTPQDVAGTLAPGAHPGGITGREAESGHLIANALTTSGTGVGGPDARHAEAGHLVALSVGTKMGRCNSTQETLVSGAVNAGYGKRGYAPNEMHNYVAAPITADPYADRPAEESNLVLQDVADTLTSSWHQSQGQKAGNNVGLLNPVISMSGRWRGDDGRGYDRPPHVSDLPALDCTKVETVAGPAIGVRRLTPTECERLQGFDDGWTAWGIDERGRTVAMSDAARYRMLGNAVCRKVAIWLANRITQQFNI